jgi:phosphonate transport system permease protein
MTTLNPHYAPIALAVTQAFSRKRAMALGIPAALLLYLIYAAIAFDVAGLAARARLDNAAILFGDFWSYKTHVTQDTRTDALSVSIEGERKGVYSPEHYPDWIKVQNGTTTLDLGGGHVVTYGAGGAASYVIPDYGTVNLRLVDGKVALDAPQPLPAWISAAPNRVAITTDAGRFSYSRSKIETFRYQAGWEMFFFTLDSDFAGRSWGELAQLAVFGDRIDPARSNIAGMAHDFWTNAIWRHNIVAWAVGETLLMAVLGTLGAAIIALPLAFVAARNFNKVAPARFGIRRVFDFIRGVDGLIWTLFLVRAFGPGPMTGALAMMITDTGTFGKVFSEGLENIDEKQVEGLRSTGANRVQQVRFGVIPQIVPVLLSQVLYFLESNTRSATVIGAIVGGGIGLLITQAIQTQRDWEKVAYYMVLIVLMVILMDALSSWLRRKLIKG